MNLFDPLILVASGLCAVYLIWKFYGRYSKEKAVHIAQYLGVLIVGDFKKVK